MTVSEAHKIVRDYEGKTVKSAEDDFMFTEAMKYLISELKDPDDMLYLGGHYYDLGRFDLALKYYELAAGYGLDGAYECLGYIWYYGRTGTKDYEKAFGYYSKSMENGNLTSAYKVADMYKNGYFVEQDYDKYVSIIEDLYIKVRDMNHLFDPVPEVFTRLADIRVKQGDEDEAVRLFLYAKNFLAQRIEHSSFFGNLSIMKWLVNDLYSLVDFDKDNFDLFDLYYLLKKPSRVHFRFN